MSIISKCIGGVVVATIVLITTSCGSNINMADKTKYLTKIDSLTITALDPIIQKNDILSIDFSVAGSEEAQKYMAIYNGTSKYAGSSNNLASTGYLVSPKGTVTIPSIGEVDVAGKTKAEIIEVMQAKLKKFIQLTPVVSIRILNFRVYIEGEVIKPGTIDVQNEVLSLQEAITIAGGNTPYAVLSDVEIQRRENGVTKIAHIDLRGEEIYTTKSEYFYLKQGDLIRIKADKEKFLASNGSTARTAAYATSIVSVLITLFTVLRN